MTLQNSKEKQIPTTEQFLLPVITSNQKAIPPMFNIQIIYFCLSFQITSRIAIRLPAQRIKESVRMMALIPTANVRKISLATLAKVTY